MKEQLTIQELSAYLPWDVRFDNGRDYEKDYLKGIRSNSYYVPMAQGSRDNDYFRFEKIKLVLYPLSHLTKEIEHKGEKFVPIERLFDINLGTEWSKTNFIETGFTDTEWWVCLKDKPSWYFGYNTENGFYILCKDGFHKYLKKANVLYQKLAEWHMDFQNLIPRGLAIDKTTIQ